MTIKNIFVFVLCISNFSFAKEFVTPHIFSIINLIGMAAHDNNLMLQVENELEENDMDSKSLLYNDILPTSLKDLHKIDWVNFIDMYEYQIYKIFSSKNIDKKMVIDLQRKCRNSIKKMIINLENIPESYEFSILLQELFHDLHEVKKQVTIVDYVSEYYEFYIYLTLSLLDFFMKEMMISITSTSFVSFDQQKVLDEGIYLVEQFKNNIKYDLTISKRRFR